MQAPPRVQATERGGFIEEESNPEIRYAATPKPRWLQKHSNLPASSRMANTFLHESPNILDGFVN